MSTQFGVRPDSHSVVARKIEAFVKARAAQRLIPVFPTFPRPVAIVPKKDWRPLREFLCERYAADRVRVLTVRVLAVQRQFLRTAPPHASGVGVLAMVAEKRSLPVEIIRSVARTHAACVVRHEAAYEMAERTHLSLTQIGKLLGGRDHTSVGYMIFQHAARNDLPIPRGMVFRRAVKRRQITYSGWEAVPV